MIDNLILSKIGNLTDSTTPGQSGYRSNGNEESFQKGPGVDPHHQMQFSAIIDGENLPLYRGEGGVFYSHLTDRVLLKYPLNDEYLPDDIETLFVFILFFFQVMHHANYL